MEKINLKDCTFIIPLMIESEDREKNFRFVLKYLYDKFDTNIIITEANYTNNLYLKKYYSDILTKANVTLIEKPNEKHFHRTRYLNEMLNMVKTKITVNYDIDVFFPMDNYVRATQLILKDDYDLVYPFGNGNFQYEVPQKYRDELMKQSIITKIDSKRLNNSHSEFGHCQFFNTESYKKGYGENEDFISYGPEDQERYFRFRNLGYKTTWLANGIVYHLAHIRTKDSGIHEFTEHNNKVWQDIKEIPKKALTKYYNAKVKK
jgi:hypothetical protein